MLARLGRLYRCTQHVPMRQLGRRVWLNAKRRLLVSPFGALFQKRHQRVLPTQSHLPQRIMPLRTSLVEHVDGEWYLRQLGDRYRLTPPIDWQLQSHPNHTHLQRLALHYHEFLEAIPGDLGRDILLDWIEKCPPWRPGYWLDNWNCYAISLRCVCWMQWYSEHHDLLSEPQRQRILTSLVEQVEFLQRNLETDICGNHLIKNIRCLIWSGSFFAGPAARKWKELGLRLLHQQLPTQILADGVHFELSPAYHCQVFVDLLECASVLSGAERDTLMATLARSSQALSDLTHPDGWISLFSDGGLEMVYSPDECLAAWHAQAGRTPKSNSTIALRQSGYYGARFKQTYFLADCGPLCADALPAHGHGDLLAFEWDVGTQRVVVDAGVAEYEPGAKRDWSRSTRAHNTLTIDNQDQAEFIGSFRTGRRSHASVVHNSWNDQTLSLHGHYHLRFSNGDFHHQREFRVNETSLHITDRAHGSASGEVISRLLFHHDCEVRLLDDSHAEVSFAGTRVRLSSNRQLRLVSAHWSPNFGEWRETTQLEVLCGTLPCDCWIELALVDAGSYNPQLTTNN